MWPTISFIFTLQWLSVMSSTICKEGEVQDLDGSCVTKFVLPEKKSSCPDLILDNGIVELVGGGRLVEFRCNEDYIRVPDTEVALCQLRLGTWSKQVPMCLKPGCQVSSIL